MSSSCIIRTLVYQHSFIDAYPECFDSNSIDSHQHQQEERADAVVADDVKPSLHRKEDLDVFVFKQVMQRLSPAALLHILGNGPEDSTCSKKPVGVALPDWPKRPVKPAFVRSKPRSVVRFALDPNTEKVRVDVKSVEKTNQPELWWNAQEFMEIRQECRDVVLRFTSSQSNTGSYTRLIKAELDRFERDPKASLSRQFAKSLLPYEDARGLEMHIVAERTRIQCQRHVQSVVAKAKQQQLRHARNRSKNDNNSSDVDSDQDEELRATSRITSRSARRFAQELAELDRTLVLRLDKTHSSLSYCGSSSDDDDDDLNKSWSTVTTAELSDQDNHHRNHRNCQGYERRSSSSSRRKSNPSARRSFCRTRSESKLSSPPATTA